MSILPATRNRNVSISVGEVTLGGDLVIPTGSAGIVLFAHGSGSGRHSPRNRFVAGRLQDAGLATLLIDLLAEREEQEDAHTGHLRFDIPFLADRLVGAIRWLANRPETAKHKVGLFGASTGGGAALVAAARLPENVGAVVSRGGRPDLAGNALLAARCPTLLIVGGDDHAVFNLNEDALGKLGAPIKELALVPGASHLFEEPGTLDKVAQLASDWFRRYLSTSGLDMA